MQTDELRAELAELAREVDPFPEELPAIRRRVARRRVANISIAAVLVIGLVTGAIVTTRSSGDHVSVASRPKQVTVNALPRVDALVALPLKATADDVAGVKATLDATAVVEKYTTLPPDALLSMNSGKDLLHRFSNLWPFIRTYGRGHDLRRRARSLGHATRCNNSPPRSAPPRPRWPSHRRKVRSTTTSRSSWHVKACAGRDRRSAGCPQPRSRCRVSYRFFTKDRRARGVPEALPPTSPNWSRTRTAACAAHVVPACGSATPSCR